MPKFMSIETHTFPASRWEEGDAFVEEIKRTGVEVG